jgi:hypothetical protein
MYMIKYQITSGNYGNTYIYKNWTIEKMPTGWNIVYNNKIMENMPTAKECKTTIESIERMLKGEKVYHYEALQIYNKILSL